MRKLFTTKRALRTAMLSAVLAFPLLGAGECADITGSDDSSSSSYDGTYDLVSVDGKSASTYDIIRVDANNRLVLYRGVWTLSGRTLTTEMSTYSIVNGVRKDDPRFQPERHTGTVTISGGTATGTLDSGSSVSTTLSSGTMLTSYSGHQMKFAKR
jgi:hypothetical protein